MATVLVVEDDDSSRLLIKSILRASGHRVIETRNGNEAVRELTNGLPDIMITDLLMPKMDGLELIARVRSDFSPVLPIIVISAVSIEATTGIELNRLGITRFFSKPFENDGKTSCLSAFRDAVKNATPKRQPQLA